METAEGAMIAQEKVDALPGNTVQAFSEWRTESRQNLPHLILQT